MYVDLVAQSTRYYKHMHPRAVLRVRVRACLLGAKHLYTSNTVADSTTIPP